MRRRLLFITLALLASVIVVVATIPLWLGVATKLAARSRGVTFGSYERIGYSRFVLRDVDVRLATVHVTATRAEVDTPVVWLWRHWRKRSTAIVAGDWRVEVQPSTTATPKKPSTEKGWLPLRALLQRIATQLDRWAPHVTAGAGVVTWPGSEISVRTVKWAGRELALDGVAYKTLRADATVAFAAGDTLRVKARLGDDMLRADLVSQGAHVSGNFALWEQPASLTANFAPRGWLPAEASIDAKEWKVAGERLKLGSVYSLVRGSAQIEWRAEHFVADINASSEPVPGKSAPPLDLVVRGKGDMQAFTIESLNATLPGVTSRLTDPVTIERNGKIRESAARFALQADLAKMPWFSAAGAITGEARLVSGFSASPSVEFSLHAQNVSMRDVAVSDVNARGRLDWPRLQISEGAMVGGEGERLTWHGGWNFQTKEILDAAVEGQIRRHSIARWLPKQPEFDVVKLRASASGALAEVKHQGNANAEGVKVNGVSPLAIVAAWQGRGINVDEFKVEARAGASTLIAAGKLDASSLQVTSLDFTQADASRLKLGTPATIRWRPQLQVESLRLAGPEGQINASATMGEKGRIEVAAKNVSSKWLSDFVAMPGPAWTVSLFGLVGSWEKGPMTFSLTTGASLEIGEGRAAAVNISGRGDKDGVRIEALRATEGDAAVINATGRLPVVFTPGGSPLMHMDPNGALVLDATVAPNADFWQKLATMTGVELKDPRASARLTGTWQQPQGSATLQAAGVTIDPKRIARPLPAIQALDVQVSGDRSGVTLQKFSIEVEGQSVRAAGRLPVPNGNWSELFKAPLATAQRGADVRLEIPDAEVAVFTRFLPAVLAPKGRLQLDVQYKGGELEGFMRLRDAASRPLGPLGVLQEINADIAMSGRKLALRGVTAKSGGQPVTLNGIIELPEKGSPQFDLALRGENLPFVRQTGLLMRGDLDLKLQTTAGAQPRLSGNVRLRDSLFLSDVRSFLPKGGASASRRPPYFSIEAAPVNVWSLAVDVVGDRFLRLRTPVFTGVASARFRLGGTLGEPRAIGEITVDEGAVRMPFASFSVTQGSVRLTEADPFEPSIYLRGTGRRYGYDVTMEIDGKASQPNVVFMSSPPLDSEQVLLMVMTGAAPSNEINKSATQRAANIGIFLSQSLLGSLGADAAEADKLSLATGEKISRQGKETYDIEYKLSDRWTLTGEYNEYDEYNAGLKWRVFRGKRAGESTEDAKK